MNYLLLNIFLTLCPALILLGVLLLRRHPRRPPRVVWLTFVAGFFAVLPVALVQRVFEGLQSGFLDRWRLLFRAFLIAGLLEEGIKAGVMALFFILQARSQWNWVTRPKDLMFYTMTAGIGFAVFENILYSFDGTGTVILRGVTALPLHVIASGFIGLGLGMVFLQEDQEQQDEGDPPTSPDRPENHGKGKKTTIPWLAGAVLLHGSYNFLLFLGGIWAFLIVPVLISGGILLFRLYIVHSEVDTEVPGGE